VSRGKPITDPPDGFADLVREHWEPVFRYLMSHVRRTHDAEELTQETFLRALSHWATRDPDTRPRAWLLRIARNLFLDAARRWKTIAFCPLGDRDPGGESSPDRTAEVFDDVRKVRLALAELTELPRSVFLLRVEGELSFAEIAAAVGTSEEAARWHMHQARTKLAAQLRGDE
jgi:RNA polymerase sigma-70 factor, ECF subfamily